MTRRTSFDEDYYRRFYGDDPVHTAEKVAALASAVHSLTEWWDLPVTSVLDIGAGPGYWRDWYAANRPSVDYVSVDVSEHACRTYGHQQRDITQWRPNRAFDLVVCHGVLHYLDAEGAESAVANIAAAARGIVYIEAPTKRDLEEIVDTDATDMDVHRRTGAWYRKRLDPHFSQIGAGLWLSRRCPLPLYELERGK
jgi:SAM-dependent methyltransferase